MLAMILRRLGAVVPMLFVISVITFSLVELIPGDVAQVLTGDDSRPETAARIRAELGLDKPPLERYVDWVARMARGDFGRSLYNEQPVAEQIVQRLPTTLSLTVLAVLMGLLLGVPAGIAGGVSDSKLLDRCLTVCATASVAVPSFVVALLLALCFSVTLRWFPTIGYVGIGSDPLRWLHHMLLPSLALSLTPAAVVARQLRSGLKEVLTSDYVRTARAKGLTERQVILRHGLRNASGPALTALGVQIASLLSGAVAVELVFALPGLGLLAINAVSVRDLTVIQGVVVVGALTVVLLNLVIDILYVMLNPKVVVTA